MAKLNGGTSQNTVFIVTAIAVLYFPQSTVIVTSFHFPVMSHRFLFLQCCLFRRLLAFDMENYKTSGVIITAASFLQCLAMVRIFKLYRAYL